MTLVLRPDQLSGVSAPKPSGPTANDASTLSPPAGLIISRTRLAPIGGTNVAPSATPDSIPLPGKFRLRMRSEQMAALSQYSLDVYVTMTVTRLRSRYKKWAGGRSESNLKRWVRQAVDDAATFGLLLADDVDEFIDRRVHYGTRFPTGSGFQWALSILQAPDIADSEKMDRLMRIEAFKLRSEG